MPQGNGDPKLCLFPERVTPNHHKLAEEFVLLDNFLFESGRSAPMATSGAWPPMRRISFEKMWPLNYGHNHPTSKFPYPAEGKFPIACSRADIFGNRARRSRRELPKLRRICGFSIRRTKNGLSHELKLFQGTLTNFIMD